MATPYENVGGLLGDPEELKRLLAQLSQVSQQFAPSEADQRTAQNQALITAGLSLLGTRKGEEWDRLGLAGFNALDARDRSLTGAQAAKRAQMSDATSAMDMLSKLRAQQQSVADQRALGGIFGGAAPGMAPGALPAGAAGPPADPASIAPDTGSSKAQQYRQAAAMYAARGNVDAAKKYAEIADKMEEEYATTLQPVKGADGVIRMVQVGKRGNIKTAEGMGPAEKAHFLDTGAQVGAVDPFTGQPIAGGGLYNKQPTPGEQMTDVRAREQFDYQRGKDAADNTKPQIITGPNGEVYAVNPRSGTGAPVMGPDGQPLNKGEKPLTESQAKATAYINNMEDASKVLVELDKKGFNGKTRVQQAEIVNAGSEGIPYVPGSGMVQRSMSSDNAQVYHQAQLQWTESALRFMTGANAPESEVIRSAATYFPRPGDGDAAVARKEASRANMEQSMRLAAGRGSDKVPATRVTMDREPTPQEAAWMKMPRGTIYTAPDGSKRVKQ